MKKIKIVKIKIDEKTEKEFTVTELSVGEIIKLSQTNSLFGATLSDSEEKQSNDAKTTPNKVKNRGLLDDILDISKSAKEVMKKSCDFGKSDLEKLPPSDVKILFDDWKEVNGTFLNLLDQMGIIKATKGIAQQAISDFLKMLAT